MDDAGMRGYVCTKVVIAALLAMAGAATAQDAPIPPPPPASPPQVQGEDVTTLGEVRALKPEDDEPLDLYRFRNPMEPKPNRFSRSWSEPPTPEQVSQGGGYIMMGIYYGLAQAAKGVHKLTNGPDQIQSAIARPPPELSEEEQRRALEFCAQEQACGPRAGPPEK